MELSDIITTSGEIIFNHLYEKAHHYIIPITLGWFFYPISHRKQGISSKYKPSREEKDFEDLRDGY